MSSPTAIQIRTDRLLLRPIAPEDLDAYAGLHADPEVVRYIGDGTTSTREETAGWLERSIARNAFEGWDRRSVLLSQGGMPIGWCGIAVHTIDGGIIEREIGYVIARAYWGRGYATEAATAMRDHALGSLGLRRLVVLIDHDNGASKRVAGKLGMAYERDVAFHGRVVEMHALEV